MVSALTMRSFFLSAVDGVLKHLPSGKLDQEDQAICKMVVPSMRPSCVGVWSSGRGRERDPVGGLALVEGKILTTIKRVLQT